MNRKLLYLLVVLCVFGVGAKDETGLCGKGIHNEVKQHPLFQSYVRLIQRALNDEQLTALDVQALSQNPRVIPRAKSSVARAQLQQAITLLTRDESFDRLIPSFTIVLGNLHKEEAVRSERAEEQSATAQALPALIGETELKPSKTYHVGNGGRVSGLAAFPEHDLLVSAEHVNLRAYRYRSGRKVMDVRGYGEKNWGSWTPDDFVAAPDRSFLIAGYPDATWGFVPLPDFEKQVTLKAPHGKFYERILISPDSKYFVGFQENGLGVFYQVTIGKKAPCKALYTFELERKKFASAAWVASDLLVTVSKNGVLHGYQFEPTNEVSKDHWLIPKSWSFNENQGKSDYEIWLQFFPELNQLLVFGRYPIEDEAKSKNVAWLFDVATRKRVLDLQGASHSYSRFAVAKKHKIIFGMLGGEAIAAWSLNGGNFLAQLSLPQLKKQHRSVSVDSPGDPIFAYALHPSEDFLAGATIDGSLALFSLPTFDLMAAYDTGQKEVQEMEFTPDGESLIVSAHLGFVGRYETKKLKK